MTSNERIRYELYNLTTDPYQMNNIYSEAGSYMRAQLHAMATEYFECKGAQCP